MPCINRITCVAAAFAFTFLATGCSTIERTPGFADVQSEAALRSDHDIQWIQAAEDQAEADDIIGDLLSEELLLAEAVQIALLNNRQLQAIYEDLGVAHAQVIEAGLLENPIFDAELKFLESGGGDVFEFTIAQSFLEVLFLPLRKQVAEARFEAAKLRVTGAVLDLAAETREAYIQLQAQQQLAEMLRTVTAARYASFDTAQKLRDAGNITQLDLVNERTLYEEAKLQLASAEAAVLERREQLNVLMGLWGDQTNWIASSRLPDASELGVSPGELESQAIASSLDLRIAAREIEAIGKRLGLDRAEAIAPELQAGLAGEKEPDDTWAFGPAVAIPIPIFNFGQAATAEARATLEQAYDQFYATAVNIRGRARTAYTRAASLRDNARYYREVVLPLRTEVVQRTQEQYNAMQIGVFQLLQAKQAEVDAGRRYIETLRDYWIARSQLQQILDGRLPRQRFGFNVAPMAGGGDMGGDGGGNGGH